MNKLSYKNLLMILGMIFIIGGLFVFFDKVVLKDPILSKIFPHQQLAWVNGTGLQYSVDEWGVQTIAYNGVPFVDPYNPNYASPNNFGTFYSDKTAGAVFQTPGGATTSLSVRLADATRTVLSTCPTPQKTNEVCYQQIFREGLENSFTLITKLSTHDAHTLLMDFYVTNNDPNNTMISFGIGYLLGTGMNLPDLKPYMSYGVFATNPVAFIPGATWGSMALYTDNYNLNTRLSTSNTYDTSGNATPPTNVQLLWNLQVNDPIATSTTYHYPLYMSFGNTTDNGPDLASIGYAAYATANPSLVDWPDRRPISRWFIAEGSHTGAKNPRGYFWEPDFDVSNQTAFSTEVLSRADSIIALMNVENPKPQGILIWDLEGEEFYQIFTYVGSPDKLHDLAPEMDAVADQLMQKFTDAGYKVGLTLRPSTFQTGTTLPATCSGGGPGIGSWNDIFMKINDPYPRGGYECFSTNVWTHAAPRFPNHQTYPTTDAGFLQNLKNKVDYAYQRWGTTMFYVDSTVYGDGGNSINPQIWRDLMIYLKNTDTTQHLGVPATATKFIFFPENDQTDYYGVTAPYDQADMGVLGPNPYAKNIWSTSFNILAQITNLTMTQSIHDALVQSVTNGDILFDENAWFKNDEVVSEIYTAAGMANPGSTIYTLNYASGPHGSLVGVSPQKVVTGGTSIKTIAVADTGYYLASWSDATTTNPRIDTNVSADGSFTATFAADPIAPVITSFTLPASVASTTVSVTSLVATDNVAVKQYMIKESSTPPLAADAGWMNLAPAQYVFGDGGNKTLYVWAKDEAKNISQSAFATTTVTVNVPTTFTFVYTAGTNGSVTGTLSQTVSAAANGSQVTAVANSGYHFVNWSDNSITNPRTDLSASGNINVTANFAQDTVQGGDTTPINNGGGMYVPPVVSTSTSAASTTVPGCPKGFVCVPKPQVASAPQGGPSGSVIPSVYLKLPQGSRSTAVLTLQKYLINGEYLSSNLATGYYGPLTASAVSRYQAANTVVNSTAGVNIASSGGTAGSLTTYLFLGTNSQQVKTLQQLLNKKGFIVAAPSSGSTGNESTYFSTSTLSALQRFQCSGLGVCSGTPLTTGYGATGPRTRALLNSGTYVSTTTPVNVPKVTSPKTTVSAPKTSSTVVTPITPTINFPTTQPVQTNQVY